MSPIDQKYLQLINNGRLLATLIKNRVDDFTKELPHGRPYVEGTELFTSIMAEHPTVCANALCALLEFVIAVVTNTDVRDYDTQEELGN